MEAFNKKNNKGQSFFEVVIAMALISIVLISLISMATLSIKASAFARNQTQASKFNQEGIEWLFSEKEANWNIFKAHANIADYCFDTKTWNKGRACTANDLISGTIFVRGATFTVNADGSVTADLITSWADGNGSHSVTLSNKFSNTR